MFFNRMDFILKAITGSFRSIIAFKNIQIKVK